MATPISPPSSTVTTQLVTIAGAGEQAANDASAKLTSTKRTIVCAFRAGDSADRIKAFFVTLLKLRVEE
jgi:hypothetical protein